MSAYANGIRSLASILFLACAGQAVAASATCPPPSAIKSIGPTEDGTGYQASQGGHQWKGEVSKYDDDIADATKLTFHAAGVRVGKGLAMCDYHGEGNAALRLSMQSGKLTRPEGGSWKKEGEDASCEAADVAACPLSGI